MCECCNKKNSAPLDVNAHLHTPYSFSSFEKLTDALDMAVRDGVKVVGINDFYTTAGYEQWRSEALKRKLYPLFNIEYISLDRADQAAGRQVNDPNNPGRTYLSGKGLSCPPVLPEPYASQLAEVCAETREQVRQMCLKLNEILVTKGTGITLDFEWIERELTQGSIRERHLAKALRLAVATKCGEDSAAFVAVLSEIFGGKALKSSPEDVAGVENEIRGNLLKAGGAAFVEEDPKAFLSVEAVREMILAAGGIPTYPFLADANPKAFTHFEEDVVKTAAVLKERGIYSVEFIPSRNSIEVLERYAGYLHDEGFAVTFGSEHNTPDMEPILLRARGGAELTDKLKAIGYAGACTVAAHQALVAQGKEGYLNAEGHPAAYSREQLMLLGDQVIRGVVE